MTAFRSGLDHYCQWRTALARALADLGDWFKQQDLLDARIEPRLRQLQAGMQDDKLHVAFVAEFSRGKSELINALFFSDYGTRVLPSSAGRTTMCPTEILYEAGRGTELSLLPIETRRDGQPLSDLRGQIALWTVVPLDRDDPERMAQDLARITETVAVTPEAATQLGFSVSAEADSHASGLRPRQDGLIEVPRWRHAVINLAHPLLEQGLVILDTPGLNALGAEPELTLSLLPRAHAVLFILAADTGVTRSDLDIWQQHIRAARPADTHKGLLVALNKIDGLWDDLKTPEVVDQEIARQADETAETLKLAREAVFPVSAQKALLARIQNDPALLARSRIATLERALASDLLATRSEIVRERVLAGLSEIGDAVGQTLTQRLAGIAEHMAEIGNLHGHNQDVLDHMLDRIHSDKISFEKTLQRFQAVRGVLAQQANRVYTDLNLRSLDVRVAETRKAVAIRPTSAGVRESLVGFFGQARSALDRADHQTGEILDLMNGAYRQFADELGYKGLKPSAFSLTRFQRELARVQETHDQYARGFHLLFTDQNVLARRFTELAAGKVRALFMTANREVDAWIKALLAPLEAQVREHQVLLRRRLESIKRIHQSADSAEGRLADLAAARVRLSEQQRVLARGLADLRLMNDLDSSLFRVGNDDADVQIEARQT